ncbi:hypothetical protein TorRG33x02_103580 [Trema orientale]|uniref:Uncharacterized protein n=1 Tax=Trema orientale TaxID=63057 RepID=A0A2P5F851_TREOI|nr:hypothetical protein TorRG33x02_103580 [Trema orientale]
MLWTFWTFSSFSVAFFWVPGAAVALETTKLVRWLNDGSFVVVWGLGLWTREKGKMGNRELEELVVLWSSVERDEGATLGKKFVMVAMIEFEGYVLENLVLKTRRGIGSRIGREEIY